ncbi:hypothetical protein CROQUDRAFT_93493 [Cronartium quercuum f. sp. fusiforme G11]|uniref:Uncharacterized protein n=1 Tax=Cronartium quercuum f. sp. fusiforme G11 TaxID=708437 RepID=A0A9P6TCL6_9BASI|nr:hypothetical protein CROQUDRAFT_93493 [Cronartium quercuum f. sp. fusiforme G11]
MPRLNVEVSTIPRIFWGASWTFWVKPSAPMRLILSSCPPITLLRRNSFLSPEWSKVITRTSRITGQTFASSTHPLMKQPSSSVLPQKPKHSPSLTSPSASARVIEAKHHEQPSTECTPAPSLIQIVETHSILIWWALWGLLTRLGLNALGEFDGRSTFSVLLVQIVGCLVMGISLRVKDTLDSISWMLEVFRAFSNSSAFHRGRFYSFLDGLNQTYLTLGMSLFSIQFGIQLGSLMEPYLRLASDRSSKGAVSPTTLVLANQPGLVPMISRATILLIGPMAWIASVFVFLYAPRHWRGPVTYSLMISPIGTLTRYHLSKLNSTKLSTEHGFPIGTFLANLIATALLAIFTLLQFLSVASDRPELCGALQGLRDGFCGCLSTISTFMVELRKIRPTRHATRFDDVPVNRCGYCASPPRVCTVIRRSEHGNRVVTRHA